MKKDNYKIRQVEKDRTLYYFYEMEWNLYGRRERFYAKTEEELWEKLQETENERLKYLMGTAPENPVLNDYINLYFKGQLSIGIPSEMKSDLIFVRTMTSGSEIDRSITELTVENIQNYYKKLTAKYTTKEISRLHDILLEIFQSFSHIGVQTADLSQVQLPDSKSEESKSGQILLSEQEMETLMLQCHASRNSSCNAWVVILALHTGIYLNDIFEIRRSDVKLNENAVIINGNAVPLSGECIKWLKERILDMTAETDTLYKNPEQKESIIRNYLQSSPDKYLFTNVNGSQIKIKTVALFLKNTAKKCGISCSITPLALHRSYLANAMKNGKSSEEMKAVYGHDDKFYDDLIKNIK